MKTSTLFTPTARRKPLLINPHQVLRDGPSARALMGPGRRNVSIVTPQQPQTPPGTYSIRPLPVISCVLRPASFGNATISTGKTLPPGGRRAMANFSQGSLIIDRLSSQHGIPTHSKSMGFHYPAAARPMRRPPCGQGTSRCPGLSLSPWSFRTSRHTRARPPPGQHWGAVGAVELTRGRPLSRTKPWAILASDNLVADEPLDAYLEPASLPTPSCSVARDTSNFFSLPNQGLSQSPPSAALPFSLFCSDSSPPFSVFSWWCPCDQPDTSDAT